MGRVDRHGAHFDLIVGRWGDDTRPSDRSSISLELRRTEEGPSFMVIDSGGRLVAASEMVGTALARSEVIGTRFAPLAFEIVDAIWLQDDRIAEVVGH